jgi:acetylglutamate kinase
LQQYIEKANILIEALPYIKEFKGITVVIKYGGSALVNEEIKNTVLQDIVLMKYVGFKPVVVHGGGPDINNMLERLHIESNFVNGLRVTDEDTMEVVEMVLAGKINKAITTGLSRQGINAAGISGLDGGMLRVEKMMPNGQDIGRVGQVVEVDTTLIKALIDKDFVPVISPIGLDDEGISYNVNADYAAVAVAGALAAEKLVFLTDVAGVLTDVSDADSIISKISAEKAQQLIDEGIVSGGMIPKVECCLTALDAGVGQVHILDGGVKHCLILEIFTKEGIGTLFEKNE